MLKSKPIEFNTRTLPGDVLLGWLNIDGVAKSIKSLAVINSLRDSGPSELMVLSNQEKINMVFYKGIKSFIELLEDNYEDNRFLVFKSYPQKISFNSISSLIDNPITEEGFYVCFWGVETPTGIQKNSWPMNIHGTSNEPLGSFIAIDCIRETGMLEVLYRIRKSRQ